MKLIKKLIALKKSETFRIVVQIATLLWRLFKGFNKNGGNQTR